MKFDDPSFFYFVILFYFFFFASKIVTGWRAASNREKKMVSAKFNLQLVYLESIVNTPPQLSPFCVLGKNYVRIMCGTYVMWPCNAMLLRIGLNMAFEVHVVTFLNVVWIQCWSQLECYLWCVYGEHEKKNYSNLCRLIIHILVGWDRNIECKWP